MDILIPLAGISVGLIIPLAVFYWQYHETKNKNDTIIEISKNLDDPSKLDNLLGILDERKKEPIDYRRGGVITIFVGIGICLLGYTAMGPFFVGAGYLVGAIGIGTMVAGYLFPISKNNSGTIEIGSMVFIAPHLFCRLQWIFFGIFIRIIRKANIVIIISYQ